VKRDRPRHGRGAEWGRGARRARSTFGFPHPSLKFRTAGFPQYGFKWTVNGRKDMPERTRTWQKGHAAETAGRKDRQCAEQAGRGRTP
jgi:hypothetical protein